MTVTAIPCDVCSQTRGTTLFVATDHREQLGGQFALVRCDQCGLVRTEPRPEDVAAWYPDDYRNHSVGLPLTVRLANAALRYTASPTRREGLANALAWAVPNAAVGTAVPSRARVLDVGAGNGTAVATLRSIGLDAWGIEPSAGAVAAAHGRGTTTVVEGTLETSDLANEEWDVIRFVHVLEHVPSPVATLAIARDALAPGGRIVLLVPNFGGVGRRVFRGSWDGLELPRHLHHFTRSSLTQTLHRAGLTPVAQRTAALFGVTAGSLDAWSCQGQRQHGWGRSTVLRVALYPLELALSAVGAGDGLVAVAVKTRGTT